MVGTLVKLRYDINVYPNSDSDIYKGEVCIIIEEYTQDHDGKLETVYQIRSLSTNKTSHGIELDRHVRLLTPKEQIKYKSAQILYGK